MTRNGNLPPKKVLLTMFLKKTHHMFFNELMLADQQVTTLRYFKQFSARDMLVSVVRVIDRYNTIIDRVYNQCGDGNLFQ